METRFEGLQVARGLAAFMIAYFHSWVILLSFPAGSAFPVLGLDRWGYLSIDFFFSLSGFVICLAIDKPGFSGLRFLARRAFRLYPVYWICLFLFVKTTIWRGPVETETTLNLFYSATLLPWNGYPYYDVAWSVRHEVLFYIAASLVVPRFGLRALIGLLSLSAILAVYLDIPLQHLPLSRYHADFAVGVLAYLLIDRVRRWGVLMPLALGTVITACLFRNGVADLYFVGFFFLLAAAINFNPASRLAKAWAKVGDWSYCLYLIHPLVFLAGNVLVSRIGPLPLWSQEAIRWVSLGLCIAASYLCSRFVEKPAISLGNRLLKDRATIGSKQALEGTPAS